MACIWYGVQGEGRGHGSRSRILVDGLRARGHQVHLFTGGDALQVLGNQTNLEQIPMLRFAYFRGRLSLVASILRNFPYAVQLMAKRGPAFRKLDDHACNNPPDLVISDFEPLTCRWAKRASVPLVVVDHQHFLTDSILPRLPRRIDRWTGLFLKWSTPFLCDGPLRVVSSFHHFPPRGRSGRVHRVGCLLDPTFLEGQVENAGHVCVYLKETQLVQTLLPRLQACTHMPFEIWTGVKGPKRFGNIHIRPLDQKGFARSLRQSRWLLTTAGNQGIGEALALKKPVLAFPVPGMIEQTYNALALVESGCGHAFLDMLPTAQDLLEFDQRSATFGQKLEQRALRHPDWVDGTSASLRVIQELLGQT